MERKRTLAREALKAQFFIILLRVKLKLPGPLKMMLCPIRDIQ